MMIIWKMDMKENWNEEEEMFRWLGRRKRKELKNCLEGGGRGG